MTTEELKERKEQYFKDLKAFIKKMSLGDPNETMSSEELAEDRRLIRENKALGITEGEYLKAVHDL